MNIVRRANAMLAPPDDGDDRALLHAHRLQPYRRLYALVAAERGEAPPFVPLPTPDRDAAARMAELCGLDNPLQAHALAREWGVEPPELTDADRERLAAWRALLVECEEDRRGPANQDAQPDTPPVADARRAVPGETDDDPGALARRAGGRG